MARRRRSRKGGDVLLQLLLGADDNLGGGRRSGRAQVGDKIADGEIRLMAHGGDDGDVAGGDEARERFIVEGRQVFDAASATRDDDDIDGGVGGRLCWLKKRRPAETSATALSPCTCAG